MEGKNTTVSRRGFLGAAGSATLAGSVAASAAAAESAEAVLDSDRKIRIGVVGGGFGASFHGTSTPIASSRR